MTARVCIEQIRSLEINWTFITPQNLNTPIIISESVDALMGDITQPGYNPDFTAYEGDSSYKNVAEVLTDFAFLLQIKSAFNNNEPNNHEGNGVIQEREDRDEIIPEEDRNGFKHNLEYINIGYRYITIFFEGIAVSFRNLIKDLEAEKEPLTCFRTFKKSVYKYLIDHHELSEFYQPLLRLPYSEKFDYDRLLEETVFLIPKIENTQKVLFTYSFSALVSKFKDKVKKYGTNVEKYYIKKDQTRCFSITELETLHHINATIYCLSGIKAAKKPTRIKEEMEKIIKVLHPNEYDVTAYYIGFEEEHFNNVEYLTLDDQSVFYKDFKKTITNEEDKKIGKRMFSCCERKTFAFILEKYYLAQSFNMFVKWSPCAYCEKISNRYMKKWNGVIVTGDKHVFNSDNPCEDQFRNHERIAKKIILSTKP